jgi:hypothetical protein
MSHSTMAAVRQYEMNENITLLTTIVCAARPNFRPDQEPPESSGELMSARDHKAQNPAGRCVVCEASGSRDQHSPCDKTKVRATLV